MRVGLLTRPITQLIACLSSAALEDKLNSQFALNIQTEILRLHCSLEDEDLARPETRRRIALLRELGSSSLYRRVFDPLGFVGVANTALSLGLGAAMLKSQLTRHNGYFFGLSIGFMILDELQRGGGNKQGIEHHDVSNDAFLRFQNMFKVSA